MANWSKAGSGAAAGAGAGSIAGPWGAAIGGAIGGIGGLLSGDADPSDAELANENAARAIKNLPPLTKEQLQYTPQLERVAAQVDPAMAQAAQAGDSSFGNVSQDPQLVAAQRAALAQMTQQANQGFTSEDLARNAAIQATTARDAKSRQDAILSSLAARGQLGQGNELAARLAGNQQSSDAQAEAAANLEAQRVQAQHAALANVGAFSSQLGTQDVNTQLAKANGLDTMARVNASLRQQTGLANQGATNQARTWNANNQQNVVNSNAGIQNTAGQFNANANQKVDQSALDRIKAANGYSVAAGEAKDTNQASNNAAFASGANAASGAVRNASTLFKTDNVKKPKPGDDSFNGTATDTTSPLATGNTNTMNS